MELLYIFVNASHSSLEIIAKWTPAFVLTLSAHIQIEFMDNRQEHS